MANSTAPNDDDDDKNQGGFGSVTLVILCAVIIALFILAFLVYRLMLRNRWIVNHLPHSTLLDPEAGIATAPNAGLNRPRAAAAPPYPIEKLDELAPAQPFAKWKNVTETSDPARLQGSTFLICVICLDPLEGKDSIRNLPCHHIFHADCIAKWFTTKFPTCPICKFDYRTPEPDLAQPEPAAASAAASSAAASAVTVTAVTAPTAPPERPPGTS